jgi:amino acid transporter
MRSTSAMRVSSRARRAADSRLAQWLARSGLTARGVIWILIGWVAIDVALGHSSHQADQQGALQLLAGGPSGLILLWLVGIGFAGYALWRLSEAAFGVAGEGAGAGPRLKSLARAMIYAFFAYLTFEIIAGHHSNQTRKEQDLSATVMREGAGGRWLVGVAGAVIVVVGIVLITEGVRRKFMKHLQTGQMSPGTRRIIERLGMIGTVARGVVIGLAGILVIDAAVTFKPSKAGGLDKALLTLRNQPFGEILLIIAALGLITFGIYGLCEARWRRV